ncbi:SCO2322 family protein [Streptomyces sp. NPDC006678]|uniref:SCO2322 family protein n=1 Tax=Streptomyces sp. NPDC006678 TaxID=3157185 RepID=UPI0033C4E073
MRGRPAALVLALCAALVAVVTVLGAAGAAQAAGYRYWSFWQSDGGSWAYATQGPATARPADGTVDGFRFSVSADSQDSAKPRTAPGFAALCADTPAKPGTKRVGVVIDFGSATDAPSGETPPVSPRTGCAQVRTDASSAEALAAVAKPLRYNADALLCAIAGYPGTGCGEQVSAGAPGAPESSSAPSESASSSSSSSSSSSAEESDGGPSLSVLSGVAAVLALGAAAFWQSRRRG